MIMKFIVFKLSIVIYLLINSHSHFGAFSSHLHNLDYTIVLC